MSRSEINVPISTSLFLRLADHLGSRGSDRDPVDAVTTAIEFWIASTAPQSGHAETGEPSPDPEVDADASYGYWWKGLLIPSGSGARMTYKGRTYSAIVRPEGIQFEGALYSPSEFTWKITNTTRNAWRDIELQFPGKSDWISAQHLRDQT